MLELLIIALIMTDSKNQSQNKRPSGSSDAPPAA